MGFAGAGSADEDRIALGVEEGAGGEFAHLALINRRIGEDELVEVFEDWELGSADAIADRAGLPVGALGPEQAGDEGIELVAPGKGLAGDLVEAGAHAVELQFGHGFEDLMAFHQATFLMLSKRRQSAMGSIFRRSASGVVMLGGASGCRWRASTVRITSPLAMPAASASAQAASTAPSPWSSTAPSTLTN